MKLKQKLLVISFIRIELFLLSKEQFWIITLTGLHTLLMKVLSNSYNDQNALWEW